MMISKKMAAALNRQVDYEFGASLQYTTIACYFAAEGLMELSAFFARQSDEERAHALRLIKYIVDAGAQVEIADVPMPQNRFKSAEEAVALSLKQEKKVTDLINGLVDLAIKEKDHLTQNMLGWFVNEQLEEVSTMDNLLRVIQRAGEQNLIYVEQYVARLANNSPGEAAAE